eukprot:CAMPEP_0202093540 /NCGR_PEP_ID=MMETSP0964-20121228/48593_1 /ASSEMBLY_ACC=CAM_ASM_000500 /TAXON_ID=4773 /ORGANISM="Schizochytrium aggregatum, Strain ATCC28209" /LENGTH=173 /DNA_ID=CAMNT_0048661791 /DNA_START=415 /DNA_END=932 /DNA_ORIENTATION=-
MTLAQEAYSCEGAPAAFSPPPAGPDPVPAQWGAAAGSAEGAAFSGTLRGRPRRLLSGGSPAPASGATAAPFEVPSATLPTAPSETCCTLRGRPGFRFATPELLGGVCASLGSGDLRGRPGRRFTGVSAAGVDTTLAEEPAIDGGLRGLPGPLLTGGASVSLVFGAASTLRGRP